MPRFGLVALGVALAMTGLACSARRAPFPVQREVWYLAYDGDARFSYSAANYRTILTGGPHAARCETGRLFSGVILLALQARSGRWFAEWMPGAQTSGVADREDWNAYLLDLLRDDGALRRLDSAAAADPLARPIDVAVMVPRSAVARDGAKPPANGGVSELGLPALRRAFADARFRHLRLRAIYWLTESVTPPDSGIVRGVADQAHAAGLQFIWIPYFTASGISTWRTLGFDAAWLQPNYFFRPHLSVDRLDSAVTRARAEQMGLAVELDHRLLDDSTYSRRLHPYLGMLARAGEGPVVVYDGAGALWRLLNDGSATSQHLAREVVIELCRPAVGISDTAGR